MKKVNKSFRLLSVVLAVVMIFSTVSVVAYANEPTAVAENSTTGVTYTSLEEAFSAANADETIKLIDDVDDTMNPATEVDAGVILDLNGNTISAANFLSFGDVIDTSEGSVGGIIISDDISEAFTVFQANNSYLPLYDNEGGCYRFFDYQVKTLGSQYSKTADSLKFGFEIRIGSKRAYELISADPSILNLVLNLEVKNNADPKPEVYTYTCDDVLIKKYADTVVKNYEKFATTSIALTFNTTGISRLDVGATYSATPVASAPFTRVEKTGNTKTFTKS